MNITFIPLSAAHFSLLLRWLQTPHVKTWWDKDVNWTPRLIEEKYSNYVKGYKFENGELKNINAYIICIDGVNIGYIQIYSAYDFDHSQPLQGLPQKLGEIDLFIGEENYINRNLGSKAINEFIAQYANNYTHIFIDLDSKNIRAIKAYEAAGFEKIKEFSDTDKIWMLRENPGVLHIRLPKYVSDAMRRIFSKHFLKDDQLWLFGSRTNLNRRGGDIDLYIETNLDSSAAYDKRSKFSIELEREIGEQKIDVVLRLMSSDLHLLIYDVARSEGVRLV